MLRLVCSVLGVLLAGAMAHAQPPDFSPIPFGEPDEALLAQALSAEPASYDRPSSDSTTEIFASGSCSRTRPGEINVALSWQFTTPQTGDRRVDISKFRAGFASDRFLTSGARALPNGGLLLDAPEPGINYYWRLLTRTADGWRVRGAGRIEVPVCPVDKVIE